MKKKDDNASRAIPEIDIEIDGETHKVKCSFGVLVRYQLLTGKNLMKESDRTDLSPLEYVQFLACAIYTEEPVSKVVELQNKISGYHLKQVAEIISAIFATGTSEEVESDEKKQIAEPEEATEKPEKAAAKTK